MTQRLRVHPQNPQPRLLDNAVAMIRKGALAAFPTDSAWALGGHIGDAALLERIRRIRGVDERHHFTLLCSDLSQIAIYARVDNTRYRLLKAATPGPYTFILEGTRELPRRVMHPKRKTIGLRVPDHPVTLALLAALGEPLLSSTLLVPGAETPCTDADSIIDQLGGAIDVVIDSGACGVGMTTVVNLVSDVPEVVRVGAGSLTALGLSID